MFGSVILEVAIGLVFIYLLLSLVCSAAKEVLEALMKKRAIDLERGLREMLGDPKGTELVKHLYDHPLIDGLFKGSFDEQKGGRFWTNLPSYIPSENFARALLDVILHGPYVPPAAGAPPAAAPPAQQPPQPLSVEQIRDAINGSAYSARIKRPLLALVNAAGNDLAQARANVEAWFNSTMDRVAGWYKRWSQWLIFALGLVLVGLLNVDTLALANSLAGDPARRQSLVAAAQETVRHPPGGPDDPQKQLKENLQDLQNLGLAVGWAPEDGRSWPRAGWRSWAMKVVGLLVTAVAITLGAPFWFDLLNKFMVVRSTVKPEEKSHKEKAKN
jgi:hypothetical protein